MEVNPRRKLQITHLEKPGKIVFPQGIGTHLFPVTKTISISGALTTNLWTGEGAELMLASGKPFFVLPHFADAPLRGTGLHALGCFAKIWQSAPLELVEAAPLLPGSDWVRQYHLKLLERLAALPLRAMFPTLQTIHQLEGVCGQIVDVARGPNSTDDEAIGFTPISTITPCAASSSASPATSGLAWG